jgi:protein-S-isoprenylcysteine O-methyltransferase Ste14
MRDSSHSSSGREFVLVQTVLLVLIVAAGFARSGWIESIVWPSRVVGASLIVLGIVVVLRAWRELGPAATPLPKPREEGSLIVSGLYRYVRHPIYGAGIAASIGYSLVTTSWPSLALTTVLGALWEVKSRREEGWLSERYAGYAAYRRKTRRKFLPFVY